MANKLIFAIPVEHDQTKTYERNIIVFVGKKAYTSLQDVPANTAITNTTYWSETGVPVVDLSEIRNRLNTCENDIDTVEGSLSSVTGRVTTNEGNISLINTSLTTLNNSLNSVIARLDNIMVSLYTPPTTS